MTLAEILSEPINIVWEDGEPWEYDETLDEAKVVTPLDYKRHWEEWPLSEKHYSKKTGNRLYGRWVYDHRENAGAKYGDGKIVHAMGAKYGIVVSNWDYSSKSYRTCRRIAN